MNELARISDAVVGAMLATRAAEFVGVRRLKRACEPE